MIILGESVCKEVWKEMRTKGERVWGEIWGRGCPLFLAHKSFSIPLPQGGGDRIEGVSLLGRSRATGEGLKEGLRRFGEVWVWGCPLS